MVLLDFWTYCCINCLHVLPDLAYLERKYREAPFLVIGVHAAKFDNEQDPENIRQAIIRHDIEHPVVVDNGHEIWNNYLVRAWPTFVLIGADGRLLARGSGKGFGMRWTAASPKPSTRPKDRAYSPRRRFKSGGRPCRTAPSPFPENWPSTRKPATSSSPIPITTASWS